MIVDISEGGARLYAEVEVPAAFTLAVSENSVNTRRDVAWSGASAANSALSLPIACDVSQSTSPQ
jgi:hypothetical protein